MGKFVITGVKEVQFSKIYTIFQNCLLFAKAMYGVIIKSSTTYDFYPFEFNDDCGFHSMNNCTSLEWIKIYEFQHFRQNALLNCSNLKRIPLLLKGSNVVGYLNS